MLKISEALIKFDEKPLASTAKVYEGAERILRQYRESLEQSEALPRSTGGKSS